MLNIDLINYQFLFAYVFVYLRLYALTSVIIMTSTTVHAIPLPPTISLPHNTMIYLVKGAEHTFEHSTVPSMVIVCISCYVIYNKHLLYWHMLAVLFMQL